METFSRISSHSAASAVRHASEQQQGRVTICSYTLGLSFEEAVSGTEKEVEIDTFAGCSRCSGSGAEPGTRETTCPACQGSGQVVQSQGFFRISTSCARCQGTGKVLVSPCKQCQGQGRMRQRKRVQVKVPAGVDSGTRLRLRGEGESGYRGGAGGDLYVRIEVASASANRARRRQSLLQDFHLLFAGHPRRHGRDTHLGRGKIPPDCARDPARGGSAFPWGRGPEIEGIRPRRPFCRGRGKNPETALRPARKNC